MSKRKLTKEKLSIHLQRKKIDFTNYNQEQLETIFFKRNYYYKFASYKKNFEKNKFGEYSNLSVQQLEKLSILDTLLRYFFLNLTMDIEHYSKTYILELISEISSIDGYQIVDDFYIYQLRKNMLSEKLKTEQTQYVTTNYYVPAYQHLEHKESLLISLELFNRPYRFLDSKEKVKVTTELSYRKQKTIEKMLQNNISNFNNSVQGKNYSNYHSRLNNITSNEYKSLIRKVEKEKLNKIKEYEKNIYSNDKIIKNKNNISIWFLLDTVTFAEYIKFIEFFYEKYHNIISSHDSSRIKELKSYIYIAKDFRNILAHNQVILLNIKQHDKQSLNSINNYLLKSLNNVNNRQKKRLLNNRIHDLSLINYIYFFWIEDTPAKIIKKKEFNKIIKIAKCLPKEITSTTFFKDLLFLFENQMNIKN